jgi:hypothetical protein
MMQHKAFLFDYAAFDRELRPLLEGALYSGSTRELLSFLESNLHRLRDPYEGEPLNAEWHTLIQTPDIHHYGDFALTKYYDPTADIGLGTAWEEVQESLARDSRLATSPILGRTVGPDNDPLDPGKMGAYFQSPELVHANWLYLSHFAKKHPSDSLNKAVQMLHQATQAKKGLFVTF